MINADLIIPLVKQYINIFIEWKQKCLVETQDLYLQLITFKTGKITVFDLTLVFQGFEWEIKLAKMLDSERAFFTTFVGYALSKPVSC